MQYGLGTELLNSLNLSTIVTGRDGRLLMSSSYVDISACASTTPLHSSPDYNCKPQSPKPPSGRSTQPATRRVKEGRPSQINEAMMTSDEALGFAPCTRELPLQQGRPNLLSLLFTQLLTSVVKTLAAEMYNLCNS